MQVVSSVLGMVKEPKRAKSRIERTMVRILVRAGKQHVKLRKLSFVTC